MHDRHEPSGMFAATRRWMMAALLAGLLPGSTLVAGDDRGAAREDARRTQEQMERTTDQAAQHLREVRQELAAVSAELEGLERDRKVGARTIELVTADLEKLDAERDRDEIKRLRSILRTYADRVQDATDRVATLARHRVELADLAGTAARHHEESRFAVERLATARHEVEQSDRVVELRREERDRPRERDGRTERQVALADLEIMRTGLDGLREAGREDAADLLHGAIRAREVRLERRDDREARQIIEQSPSTGQQIELCQLAARLWAEFGHERKAHALNDLAERMAGGVRRRQQRNRDDEPNAERREARRQLEIMRAAMPALREANRRDAAELLEHAIHVRELGLEGRRDKEARRIRETAPSRAQTVELLRLAADLWREFGDVHKAEALDELAEKMSSRRRGGQTDERERRTDRRERTRERAGERESNLHRIEQVQAKLEEIHEMVERLWEELERIKKSMDES